MPISQTRLEVGPENADRLVRIPLNAITPERDSLVIIDHGSGESESRRSITMLSKSDFKLARTCDAKLFFRENGYPTNTSDNPYLLLLAEGGYMVEALAKAKHPDGLQVQYGKDVVDDFAKTMEALRADSATLFEATLLIGRCQARVDILEKKGNVVRIFEVKAKSFDGAEHERLRLEGKPGVLRGVKAPYKIRSEWQEKLEDITFQVLLLEKLLPHANIEPYLVLVDKSKRASIDNIPNLFQLERRQSSDGTHRLHSAQYVGTSEQLKELDLITSVAVSDEVELLREEVAKAIARFEGLLDSPLDVYLDTLKRTSECRNCEFRLGDARTKDGFKTCWGPLAEADPHMLELYHIGTAKGPNDTPLIEWMVSEGKASLIAVPPEGLRKKDGTIGATAERQLRQIEYTGRGEIYIGRDLRAKIEALSGPMHFIDFETSRLAMPYHRGMRPYGLVAFQWSSHAITNWGEFPRHVEWLNNSELWPNLIFAQSLRAAIGDYGPVLTWSHFESTTLKQIIEELQRFGHNEPDLVSWIMDLNDNRIVDMHKWATSDYFHPAMGGRTSIKVVLDAIWRSDEKMRSQFVMWTGSPADEAIDPYNLLPPIEIAGVTQDVREGTAAMRAYQEMMYGADKLDREVAGAWARLLRQYCALDTLSMVLIMEHWRRQVGLA